MMLKMEAEVDEGKTRAEVTRKLEKKILKRVRKTLEKENLYEMTEKKVREKASEELGINLSDEHFKSTVRRAVEDFLEQLRNRAYKNQAQHKEDV